MSWASSNRRAELPPNWADLRKQVRSRAQGKCEAPGCRMYGTDCDHIQDRNNHTLSNLQWLCKQHHQAKTQGESQAARQKLSRRRPTPRPVGMGGTPLPPP